MGADLDITGLAEGHLTWDELTQLPGAVADASGVADGAVGGAVPVRSILASVAVPEAATHGSVVSRDGSYTASIPLSSLLAGGWLAISMDGGPLPAERGGPLRLTVAEGDTLCWNVKDVGAIRLTAGPEPDNVSKNPSH